MEMNMTDLRLPFPGDPAYRFWPDTTRAGKFERPAADARNRRPIVIYYLKA
jgi:hypothetical protein